MFLNTSKFKKQIKKAYEGLGVHIMRFDDNYFAIDAGWWFMEVHKDDFTKENMAAIISVVGPFPDKGHAIMYQKGRDPQEEMLEVNYHDLRAEFDGADDNYKLTNVIFRTQNSFVEVMQANSRLEHVLVPAQFIEMIDTSKTEPEEKMYSDLGYSSDELDKIYWASDKMILASRKRPCRFLGEKTFLEAVSRIDLKWAWKKEEMIEI